MHCYGRSRSATHLANATWVGTRECEHTCLINRAQPECSRSNGPWRARRRLGLNGKDIGYFQHDPEAGPIRVVVAKS